MSSVVRSSLSSFTSVVLSSWLPLYYEVKLLILCWLMFFHGADGCYRAARRALSRTRRAMPPPPELLAGVSRVCQVTLNAALGLKPVACPKTRYAQLCSSAMVRKRPTPTMQTRWDQCCAGGEGDV